MSADGEPINNPEGAKRVEVDRVKGLIKADNLIFREHNVDNPGPNDIDGKERDLIRSFGLEKIETVQQLFDSVNDPNRGHDVPKEKLDILATAVCESIIEAGKSDIVVAGSLSVDKQLLWTEFSVRDKNNEEAPSFAFMVAEKFRERFSAGETRNNVATTMEYLDYIKNSDYGKNGGLEEAANEAYKSLLQTKPNVLSKREMQARAAALRYVSSLRGEKPIAGGNKKVETSAKPEVNTESGNKEDDSDELLLDEEDKELLDEDEIAAKTAEEVRLMAQRGEESDNRASYSYDMKYATFVNLEMYQTGIRWYSERPPQWYEDLPIEQQKIINARVKLMNAASWKVMYRNRDLGKLIDNPDLELENKEFELLWKEMPGFKESLQSIVKQFSEEVVEDGHTFLRFKTKREYNLDKGREEIVFKDDIYKKVTDYEQYREDLAGEMVAKRLYPGLSKDEQIIQFKEDKRLFTEEYTKRNFDSSKKKYDKKPDKEIDNFGVYFNRKIEKAWARKTGINEERAGVAAAASFLSVCNFFESIDLYRNFTPMKNISDKIRTAIHPYYKAVGKWGVFKKGEEMLEYKTGQTEFFAGELALWVQSRMDSPIDGKEFRQKILTGELKVIPRTMGVSAIEAMTVNTAEGKMTLAKALMNDKEIVFAAEKDRAVDMFTTPIDLMKGYATILSVLQGELKYDAGKNGSEWITKVNSALGMIRQSEWIYKAGKGPIIPEPKTNAEADRLLEIVGPIPEVDTPEFFAYLLAAGVGFDTNLRTPFLNASSMGRQSNDNTYDLDVKHLINQVTLKSPVSRREIAEILSATKRLGLFGPKFKAKQQAIQEQEIKEKKYRR